MLLLPGRRPPSLVKKHAWYWKLWWILGHIHFILLHNPFIVFAYLQETLIHSSNCLAIKGLKSCSKNLIFVKSCMAFCEVTLPSISAPVRQLNLYLETAEVMFSSLGVYIFFISLTLSVCSFMYQWFRSLC